MGRRSEPPFHNPFAEAGDSLRKRVRDFQREEKRAREAARVPAPAPAPAPVPTGEAAEAAAFRRAMAGVQPLPERARVGAERDRDPPPVVDEDAEATAQLADLVAGTGPFDISDTVEYVEGVAQGVDRRLLRRLRRGDFALQGHCDLHGLSREEAREAVERFVTRSRAEGKRCVLVIHGRGLNSKDQEPVLKPALVGWLSRGRVGRLVLAFATARPPDGGAGAVYVLLRR